MSFDVITATQQALWLTLILAGPIVLTAAGAGLLIALFQAVTQLQEQTVAFAVKLIAATVAIFITGGLIGESLLQFTEHLLVDFPVLVK